MMKRVRNIKLTQKAPWCLSPNFFEKIFRGIHGRIQDCLRIFSSENSGNDTFGLYVHRFFKQATIALVFCILAISSLTNTAHAVSLKQNSVIRDNTIKLGDIFYGLRSGEERVLGPAPSPGKDMVLNARTLLRIARALDVPWRPASTAEFVVLKRAASVVDRETIEAALKNSLSEKGLNGHYNLVIPYEMSQIILPEDQPAQLEVTNISYNPSYKRFEASVAAPSADNPIHRMIISGNVEHVVQIPVVNKPIRNGMVIGAQDIKMVDMRQDKVHETMLLSADDLIGMTARRVVVPGEPIVRSEIIAPQIIARGETVTMTFQEGVVQLTALGRAMESGAKGDVIRVVNMDSSRSIQAIVTGKKAVQVGGRF